MATTDNGPAAWAAQPLPHVPLSPRPVVHAHTPTDSFLPEVHGNRIAVDTGAFGSGHLTCAVLASDAPPRFLATDDSGRRIATGEVRPLDFRK